MFGIFKKFKGTNHKKFEITSIQFHDPINKMVEKEMAQLKSINDEKEKMNGVLHNVIDVHEAASILNVSPGHIKNLCAQGKIVAKKIGNTWVIDRSRL